MIPQPLQRILGLFGIFNSVSLTPTDWDSLQQTNARLHPLKPFSEPCHSFNTSVKCSSVIKGYTNSEMRTHHPNGYVQLQWETCQSTNEHCLLHENTLAEMTHPRINQCNQGSVSDYFIDVQKPSDVVSAFNFSRLHNIPLVIKNTGHDYKGRSSAPGSLALWTHNLKHMSYNSDFLPAGCARASQRPAMTFGAGVQWEEAYQFADDHNITIVGGADKTVGVVGGWLQGGGHGALSNTMGLGVDRALQFKVVTPDGQYRIANECQHEDLFFALRGGGGGTFGVVMEASILASPAITLQTIILKFDSNISVTQEMWTLMTTNGLKWANDGWGGYSRSNVLILVNPKLNSHDAEESIADLMAFGGSLKKRGIAGSMMTMREFPSWNTFFKRFSNDNVATVGSSLALASRLINKSNFATPQRRNQLVSGLLAAEAATPGLIILMTTPASTSSSGLTSVTEAWRSSLYHVTVISPWGSNTTTADIKSHYNRASNSIDHLREITPDAAYVNEADVYEPNYKVAFWGTHYPELLRIKQK